METSKSPCTLSIIIVHYKNDDIFIECLKSLSKCSLSNDAEVIIVRNDGITQNEKLEAILQKSPLRFSIIVNESNLGFGKACNLGAKTAQAPHLFFLNPDTTVEADALEKLLCFSKQTKDCGIVAPRILNEDSSIQASARSFPGFRTAFFGRTSLMTRLFPSNSFSKAELRAIDSRAETADFKTVDWVSGAAMLVSKETFSQVNGFDEKFFMYWEDADLCFRIEKCNLKTYYLKTATITHLAGSCSSDDIALTTLEFHKSVYKYYCKNINRGENYFQKLIQWLILCGITARFLITLLSKQLRRR